MSQFLKTAILLLFPAFVFGATTVYKAPHVKTFDQGQSCLCSQFSTLHALEVRYLQREGQTLHLSRSAAQWNQLFDRYEEQIRGYRKNAMVHGNVCFTEASFPHDVVRQLLQYGNHQASSQQSVRGFYGLQGQYLEEKMQTGSNDAEKTQILKDGLNTLFGSHSMNVDFAKQILKDDQWVGYVPTEQTIMGWSPFVPPAELSDQLPMPEKMPLVRSETRKQIFQRIIKSLQNGVPVVYCASSHCQSIDGIEVLESGAIRNFYYADSYGENDFFWSPNQDEFSAYNGFLFLILD